MSDSRSPSENRSSTVPIANSSATEIELKLAVPRDRVDELCRHPLLLSDRTSSRGETRVRSTYFDTPDLRLLKRNMTLRIRRMGRRQVLTLKEGALRQAGLFSRREWEEPVSHGKPNLLGLSEPKLRSLVRHAESRGGLRPVFGVNFRRRSWEVGLGRDVRVEVDLDIGEIRAGGEAMPICELELELKSGQPQDLVGLAKSLSEDLPLRLSIESKAARGYALVTGGRPGPRRAAPIDIAAGANLGKAVMTILGTCVDHLAANLDPAMAGTDPEGVHQLRVALRRLLSALRLFAPLFDRDRLEATVSVLRWLTQELAPARSWDVFAGELLPPMVSDDIGGSAPQDSDFVAHIEELIERARDEAYAKARSALADGRVLDLVLMLRLWQEDAPWSSVDAATPPPEVEGEIPAADRSMPAADFARPVLDRCHRRVRKLGKRAPELRIEDLHRLRLRAKRLRYAGDFFQSLFPAKAAKAYLACVGDLQDALGRLNDAATVHEVIADLRRRDGGRQPAFEAFAARLEGWHAALVNEAKAQVRPLIKRLSRTRRFWQ
jgi:inorganic triphosphatase YgiF